MQDSVWSQGIHYNCWTPSNWVFVDFLTPQTSKNKCFVQPDQCANQNNRVNCSFHTADIQTGAHVHELCINESPRVCTSSPALPQGAPQPTDAGSICHKALQLGWCQHLGAITQTYNYGFLKWAHEDCSDHDWKWTCRKTESPVTLQWADSIARAKSPHFEHVWFLPTLLKLCSQHPAPLISTI